MGEGGFIRRLIAWYRRARVERDLDRQAQRALRQWRFEPGLRQGEPVPVLVTVEMTFTLR